MNIQCRFLIKPFSLSLLLIASSYADEIDPVALNQFRKCQTNNCSRVALDSELTFSLSRPSFISYPSISANGDQVFIQYANNAFYTPTLLLAELFDNVDGQLVSAQTLNIDPNYPNPWIGYASPDFTRFSVIDGSIGTGLLPARIRIFDSNFNQVGERIFSALQSYLSGVTSGGLVWGGEFSEDNHYVVVTYSVAVSGPTVTSMIVVLDATDPSLPIVAQTQITGFQNVYSPFLFTLTDNNGNQNLYIQFCLCNGVPQRIEYFFDTAYIPPFASQVYQVNLNAGTITLVAQQPLPKFAEADILVRPGGKDVIIAHGGWCCLFPNQISIYDTIPPLTSFLPNDNSEARVFLFDGSNLNLVVKESVNCCNCTCIYPPGNGCSYCFAQNTVFELNGNPAERYTQPEFWLFADLRQGPNGLEFRGMNLPKSDMYTAVRRFSQDGNWFLRAGAHGYINQDPTMPYVDANGIRNILLYQVSSAAYTPICN